MIRYAYDAPSMKIGISGANSCASNTGTQDKYCREVWERQFEREVEVRQREGGVSGDVDHSNEDAFYI